MTTELKLSISRFLTRSSYTLLMLTLAVHLWLQSAPWIIYVISLLPLAFYMPKMQAERVSTVVWFVLVVLLYLYKGVQDLSVA